MFILVLVTANFELASNAIATVRAVLDALDRAEDMTHLGDLKDEWFRCELCPYGVRDMVFEDLVRDCDWLTPSWTDIARLSSAIARDTPHAL